MTLDYPILRTSWEGLLEPFLNRIFSVSKFSFSVSFSNVLPLCQRLEEDPDFHKAQQTSTLFKIFEQWLKVGCLPGNQAI